MAGIADENRSPRWKLVAAGLLASTLGCLALAVPCASAAHDPNVSVLIGGAAVAQPTGVVTNAAGDVFIVNRGLNEVRELSPAGTTILAIGGAGSGNGQFNNPNGIALDGAGNIYVVDTDNNRVQKFDPAGNYLSQFGGLGTAEGKFTSPHGIAIDGSGNVYVADSGNNRVQKFSSAGFQVMWGWGVANGTAAFQTCTSSCQAGLSGSGAGQLSGPQGAATDGSGNVYIVDTANNRVERFDSTGAYQSQFGSSGSGNGQFNAPQGIVRSTSHIYVVDAGNNRVEKFSTGGIYQSQWGTFGEAPGQFRFGLAPFFAGIALDGSGNVYVADPVDSRVQKFDSTGTLLSQFGGFGSGNGQLSSPWGIATDAFGNLFVLDFNERVQKFDPAGVYQSKFGGPGTAESQFASPQGIGIDANGNIYVADTGNNRVEKFNSAGSFQLMWGWGVADGTTNAFQTCTSSCHAGFSGGGAGQFSSPHGIAIDGAGNVYVVEQGNNRVQKFDSSGTFQLMWGSGVADGTMHVAETCTSSCHAGFADSGNGQFNNPLEIALDGAVNVYVADQGNNRVERFDSTGGYESQFGSMGSGNGQFNSGPRGIAVDGTGNIYVVDLGNHRVEKFDSGGGFLQQWKDDDLIAPQGIALTPAGSLAVTTFLSNVLLINPMPSLPIGGGQPPATPLAGPTGERAAALKKCRHRHHHRVGRKCKKKAVLLPV